MCAQDADAQQKGDSSSFVTLNDDQRYDDTFAWSTGQSCVNGAGFLFFRNTCLREITIQLKVVPMSACFLMINDSVTTDLRESVKCRFQLRASMSTRKAIHVT